MNDFKILHDNNPRPFRERVIELLNQGFTVVNVWSDDTYLYAALQKIDPIAVASYTNQTWGDR